MQLHGVELAGKAITVERYKTSFKEPNFVSTKIPKSNFKNFKGQKKHFQKFQGGKNFHKQKFDKKKKPVK